jgi:hypothetical protein
MSDKDHDFGSLVCIYSQLLPRLREAGKKMGYAIALHGTMQRDLDLLAVPWVEEAAPAEDLVQFVAEAVSGFVIGDVTNRGGDIPTIQPHGRRSWNICWGGKAFIDLSVMPRGRGCRRRAERRSQQRRAGVAPFCSHSQGGM